MVRLRKIKKQRTLRELEREIAKEEDRRKKIEVKVLEQQKIQGLELKLKRLRKTPSQLRTERLARRTGRGFKLLTKKIGSAAIRQGKRIRKQQLRDLATVEKKEKLLRKKGKKSIAKKKKFLEEDFFGELPGIGFGN